VIVSDPSRSNLFGRAYSKSFTRKIVLKVGIFLQAIDKANAAGGVWATSKWVLLPYFLWAFGARNGRKNMGGCPP
jgi:hypothetical protein